MLNDMPTLKTLTLATLSVWLSFAAAAQTDELSQREHEVMKAWQEFLAEEEGVPAYELNLEPYSGRTQAEAVSRRARSHERLKRRFVPIASETLPVIETEDQSRRLTSRAVAERALALMTVLLKADSRDDEFVTELMQAYGSEAYLSPDERAYVFTTAALEEDHIQFSWRYEALYTLLWALGFTDEFGHPDEICDVEWVANTLLALGPDEFFSRARLRKQSVLLDEADLIYRYHWIVREAEEAGERNPPADINPGVVFERHYTLNWLIGYLDQDWDEVSADT